MSEEEYEDLIEQYSNVVDELHETINDKDWEIDQLKQQLAEKDKRIAELEQDRDTWKRACELASETLKQVMGKPLWIGGNIPTPEVKDSDYFYQQAKNEGEK